MKSSKSTNSRTPAELVMTSLSDKVTMAVGWKPSILIGSTHPAETWRLRVRTTVKAANIGGAPESKKIQRKKSAPACVALNVSWPLLFKYSPLERFAFGLLTLLGLLVFFVAPLWVVGMAKRHVD